MEQNLLELSAQRGDVDAGLSRYVRTLHGLFVFVFVFVFVIVIVCVGDGV